MAITYTLATLIALLAMFTLMCLWVVLRPDVALERLHAAAENKGVRYGFGAIRLLIAALLFVVAPTSKSPIVIQIFAVLSALKGVSSFILSEEKVKATIDKLSTTKVRAFAVVGLLMMGTILYLVLPSTPAA